MACISRGPGPSETLIRTSDPGGTRVPPAGSSETTVPSGRFDLTGKELTVSPACSIRSTATSWLRPTTSGTATPPAAGLLPVETLIPTIDPFGALVPGGGAWETTIPFGCVEGIFDTLTRNPSLLSVAVADASVRPFSAGTSATLGPFETVSTIVVFFFTWLPPGGAWRMTRFFG